MRKAGVRRFPILLLCLLAFAWAAPQALAAWKPEAVWGGHLKLRGENSWPRADSLVAAGGSDALLDSSGDFRLKTTLSFGERDSLEVHYEAVAAAGDTWRRTAELARLLPGLQPAGLFLGRVPRDDRRLWDLTHVLHQGEDSVAYHRLDRLALTLTRDWGIFRAGRQAVTWGNGLLFNPMDLFNPFSPTDIERDYKVGDDLLWLQVEAGDSGNLQLLFVPRRKPASGKVEWSRSSLAGKLHLAAAGTTEIDFLAAVHYEAPVLGWGAVGYLGGAAWRLDATWTLPEGPSPQDDFLSLVANLDYSWVWWGKNFYGFLEIFYNGLGRDEGEYPTALLNPDLVDRLERGELFTIGRTYLSGHLQLELHPLVNLFLTAIANVQDPSGILQPRLTWDAGQNVQILAGANLTWGSRGTEFGGFVVPGAPFTTRAADSLYLWLSWYF